AGRAVGVVGSLCVARHLFFFCKKTGETGGERDRHGAKRVCSRPNADHRSTAMTYPTHLIPTTVVGSYPQPDWLVDRGALAQHGVPRVAARDIWRIPPALLEEAQDDATVLAIGDMERA